MNKTIIGMGLVGLIACGPGYSYDKSTVFSPTRYVERQPLPPLPSEEPVPAEIPEGDWAVPFDGDGTLPPGILISERKAFNLAMHVIRYEELRTIVEENNKVISAQRDLYEETVNNLRKEVAELQPTWYERNKAYIWGAVGVVVGGGVVIMSSN